VTVLDEVFDGARPAAAKVGLASATDHPPQSVEVLGRGNRKETRLVQFDGREPVVLQLADEPARLRTEAALVRRIRAETSVPVPAVLAAGAEAGVGFLVTAYVEGADLHERFVALAPEQRVAVARTFGRSLASLHDAFRFDGVGRLAVRNGGLVADDDWRDWFESYARDAVDRLPDAFDALRPQLRAVLVEDTPPAPSTSRLYPWDFRPGNALYADGGVTAVLDWEAPLAAAPALSVAKAEYLVADWYVDDPAPLRAAFAAGYETVRPYPDVWPAHRVAAVADTAVDSTGAVTNPGYPEADRRAAVSFHWNTLAAVVDSARD
jgi:Ser/Thr protein kinase RdoA (MazF antagonist)